MSDRLSEQQVLLLNNIMYMTNYSPFVEITNNDQAHTVGEIINNIDTGSIKANQDYGSFITGAEWLQMMDVIKADPQLMSMQLAATHTDNAPGGGGGTAAIFTNPDTGEAVVTFRGTLPDEWKDNFVGAAGTDLADGVSTAQQANALAWYQDWYAEAGYTFDTITVTGHSKGGNKAKYITVLDDSVDRCISFDGQGFSDDFINHYSGQIALNQDKISNLNAEYDYVNVLLNDIGKVTFFKANTDEFVQNHCPNAYFYEDASGKLVMIETERPEAIIQLDQFINSYLRAVPDDQRQNMAEMLGDLANNVINGASTQDIIKIFSDTNNLENTSYLMAYLIEYEQANPEFAVNLKAMLNQYGLTDAARITGIVEGVIDFKYFDSLLAVSGVVANHLPDSAIEKLQEIITAKTGYPITKEELLSLLPALSLVSQKMKEITIVPGDGSDLKIASRLRVTQNHFIKTGPAALMAAARELEHIGSRLQGMSSEISFDGVSYFSPSLFVCRTRINHISNDVKKQAADFDRTAAALECAAGIYDDAENSIIHY